MSAARDFCAGLADHAAAAMGVRGHVHHLVDEAGGAHSPDFANVAEAIRRTPRVLDCEVYSFPLPSRIAKLAEQTCARARSVTGRRICSATARLVASGEADLEQWSELPDESLRARLCELPGVGAKVANCVMLFAYERLRAFPIDVWIERVLKQQYFPRKRKVTATQLRAFCETYFGEHGGYAQQYLFHHARKGGAAPRSGREMKTRGATLLGQAMCDIIRPIGELRQPRSLAAAPERLK